MPNNPGRLLLPYVCASRCHSHENDIQNAIFYFCTEHCCYFSVQQLVLKCCKLSFECLYSIFGFLIKILVCMCFSIELPKSSLVNETGECNVYLFHLLMSCCHSFTALSMIHCLKTAQISGVCVNFRRVAAAVMETTQLVLS